MPCIPLIQSTKVTCTSIVWNVRWGYLVSLLFYLTNYIRCKEYLVYLSVGFYTLFWRNMAYLLIALPASTIKSKHCKRKQPCQIRNIILIGQKKMLKREIVRIGLGPLFKLGETIPLHSIAFHACRCQWI